MKLSGANKQSPGDKYERGSERKSRLSRQLVGELQLWLFSSRGGATERKSEKESSGNGGGDLFKQRQRPWVGTLWMVSLLTYLCFSDFLCYKGQCFTCLQILLSRLERGSNKG